MKTIHTFSLSKLSDEELRVLTSNCYEEYQRRERDAKSVVLNGLKTITMLSSVIPMPVWFMLVRLL